MGPREAYDAGQSIYTAAAAVVRGWINGAPEAGRRDTLLIPVGDMPEADVARIVQAMPGRVADRCGEVDATHVSSGLTVRALIVRSDA